MKVVHNSDVKQITFLDERFYFDEESNAYFPSVTTILDVYPKGYGYHQWLKDLGNNADEVVRRAGEQGSRIHDGIAAFLEGKEISWVNGEKENYTLDEWMMILRFVEFYKKYRPETLGVEVSLVSPKLGFGGTLDYVCKLNGQIWYLDWKSGGGIYKGNKIQAAAYQRLWNESVNPKIERMGCFHLRAATRGEDKSGKQIQGEGWKLDEVADPDHLFKLFEFTYSIWKEENPDPKPKNVVYPDRLSIKELDDNPHSK